MFKAELAKSVATSIGTSSFAVWGQFVATVLTRDSFIETLHTLENIPMVENSRLGAGTVLLLSQTAVATFDGMLAGATGALGYLAFLGSGYRDLGQNGNARKVLLVGIAAYVSRYVLGTALVHALAWAEIHQSLIGQSLGGQWEDLFGVCMEIHGWHSELVVLVTTCLGTLLMARFHEWPWTEPPRPKYD